MTRQWLCIDRQGITKVISDQLNAEQDSAVNHDDGHPVYSIKQLCKTKLIRMMKMNTGTCISLLTTT